MMLCITNTLIRTHHVSSRTLSHTCWYCSYKAAGDSALLQALGNARGIQVNIVNLVEAGQGGVMGQVSSSKIRSALNQGRMHQVAESLGRPYRLVADLSHHLVRPDCTGFRSICCAFRSICLAVHLVIRVTNSAALHGCRLPIKCLQNQPPMYNQTYAVTLSIADSYSGSIVLLCYCLFCRSVGY